MPIILTIRRFGRDPDLECRLVKGINSRGQFLYDVRTKGEVSLGEDYPKKQTLGSKASRLD